MQYATIHRVIYFKCYRVKGKKKNNFNNKFLPSKYNHRTHVFKNYKPFAPAVYWAFKRACKVVPSKYLEIKIQNNQKINIVSKEFMRILKTTKNLKKEIYDKRDYKIK